MSTCRISTTHFKMTQSLLTIIRFRYWEASLSMSPRCLASAKCLLISYTGPIEIMHQIDQALIREQLSEIRPTRNAINECNHCSILP